MMNQFSTKLQTTAPLRRPFIFWAKSAEGKQGKIFLNKSIAELISLVLVLISVGVVFLLLAGCQVDTANVENQAAGNVGSAVKTVADVLEETKTEPETEVIAEVVVEPTAVEPTSTPVVIPTEIPTEIPTMAATSTPVALPTATAIPAPTAIPEPTAPIEEPIAEVVDTGFPAEYAEMLQSHNRIRAQVGRPAYTWNNDLQYAAQNWARTMAANGALQHDPNLFAIPGQFGTENISWQVKTLSQDGVVNDPTFGWASTIERDAFSASGGCPNIVDAAGRVCGHYKSIISDEFTQIGCALAPAGDFYYWVCRFK